MGKRSRHEAILQIIGQHRVSSQEQLRRLLADRGFNVTQATLSRDVRELRLLKTPDPGGGARYTLGTEADESTPPLRRLLPALLLDVDGTGNLLLVRTLTGGAQPVAVALDSENWPEVIGTIAGDDTILIVLRDSAHIQAVKQRLRELAGAV